MSRLFFLAVGCVEPVESDFWVTWIDDSGGGPDSATSAPSAPDPATIATVALTCMDVWSGLAQIQSWSADGTFTIYDARDGGYETHPMPLVGTDPGGAWEERAIGPLAAGSKLSKPGQSSTYDCSEEPFLTFVVTVSDTGGDTTDCLMWGADTATADAWIRAREPAIDAGGGCRLRN